MFTTLKTYAASIQQVQKGLLYCLVTICSLFYHNVEGQTLRAFPLGLPMCLEDDFRELEKIYNATGGNNWTNKTGWFSANMTTWIGITLTADGCDIKDINFSSNNLIGTLPNFNLPKLESIFLIRSQLNGTIPNFNLPNLKSLNLYDNQLSGVIPNFNLPNLGELDLSQNQLSGTIPSFNLPNLQSLFITDNHLNGAIPSFNLFNLKDLRLSRNQLSGTIPNFNLPNLQALSLGANQLSGTIPNFNLPNLQALNLYSNQLSGIIPNFNLTNLQALSVSNNPLGGNIPNFNLPNLKQLNLSNTLLTGSVPNFNLPNLTQLYLTDNQLTGSIPNFNLPKLDVLDLNTNELSGNIPNFKLPNLTQLVLANNQLSGCIPAGIKTNCPQIVLTYGNISNNPALATQSWENYWNNNEGICISCTAPTDITVSNITTTGATLYWSNVPGVSVYSVKIVSILTGVSIDYPGITQPSPLLLTGLEPGTDYMLTLTVSCSGPSGSTSMPLNFTTLALCNAPATPSVSAITNTTAHIDWATVTGALRYRVEYKAETETTWRTLDIYETTATLTNLFYGTAYNVKVTTVCTSGIESDPSVTVNFTTLSCGAPTNINVSNIKFTEATLSWSSIGALEYRIDIESAATGISTSIRTAMPSSLVLTGLQPGTNYMVTITAFCLVGSSTSFIGFPFTTLGRAFPVGLPTCLEDDFRELEKLYDATGGDNWTDKTGWFSANMATWKGITLTADGCDVKTIDLGSNNLVGFLPSFTLPNLTHLYLQNNQLSGTIPNFAFPNLTHLYLYINQLSGTIPNFTLSNLTHLYLQSNQLSGAIPNFNLPNLTALYLQSNQLSGAIPNLNLANLYFLYLGNNQLSGTIPNFNLPNLKDLYLPSNQLSGTIPNFNLPNLAVLSLNDNQLSGCLPSGLRSLCAHITNGNISGNPNLATQSWSAFCTNGTGECTPAYLFTPTTVKCSDPIINVAVVLGQTVQNVNEGYAINLNYNTTQLTLIDAFKGSIVPADAILLKTLAEGGDRFGIALSQNNISGSIGDTLLKLQFRLKSAAAVPNTVITVSAQIVESKLGLERVFDANKIYTVTGSSAAKIAVYNNGVLFSTAMPPTTLQWTGTNPTQTAALSSGQAVLNNTGNAVLSINRQVTIPIGAPVIGGQDAFKVWNIYSNFAAYRPTINEIIAADVNGSGTITIADITDILRRAIGLLPTGFPQTSGANKDWRFYPKSLLTTPAFTISATYPLCDGVGYCKTNVPIITNSYPLQITSTNCDTISKDWNAVLIGNVIGATGAFFRYPSVSAALRGATPTVKLMLNDSVRTANGLFIPIFITDMIPTTGLDVAFSSPSVAIQGLTDTLMTYQMDSGSNVTISAYSVDNEGVASGSKIGYLKIQTTVNRRLSAMDFGTVVANLNGDITAARVEFTSPILTIDLTQFEGHPLSKSVELTWSTASENQNERFDIQRSTDGKSFSKIGEMKGNGTTTEPHSYRFLDDAPFTGINYYRLKQVDFNEQFEFSKTISVDMLNSNKSVSIYPNPVKDNLIIETTISGDYTIELTDMTGKLLQTYKANQAQVQLSTSDLPNGIYRISIKSNTVQQIFKIVKQ